MSPQLWSDSESTTTSAAPFCSPFTIPQGQCTIQHLQRAAHSVTARPLSVCCVMLIRGEIGVFVVNDTFEVTITETAIFKPQCTGGSSGIIHGNGGDNSTVTDRKMPFYSSISPQIFAIAAATVISYFLVILIFITPRTFFVGGPGGGSGFLTRRGLSGHSSVIGVGRRPLLQKIAAVSVAISLTIATADTFAITQLQYEDGFVDSEEVVRYVVGRLEVRVAQVISDTFLWLAQVQTLIRLFPRHKEKVAIKWLGFALILLDVIFSSLNNFLVPNSNPRPLRFRDAIPALSYLFELAIGFIYASCIIYYSISKYRLAFYHAKMRNISLVALLSMASVLCPVVFFVIDVSSPDIAGWGFYIRWVGAAAASVVVWEWVERIEALERDERKDGILGREIYDGDEMLKAEKVNGAHWAGRGSLDGSTSSRHDDGDAPGLKDGARVRSRRLRSRIRFPHRRTKEKAATAGVTAATAATGMKATTATGEQLLSGPTPPAAVASPASRADTTSVASTVYAIRYHHLQTSSPRIPADNPDETLAAKGVANGSAPENTVTKIDQKGHDGVARAEGHAPLGRKGTSRPLWTAVSNPFKRKRFSPPAEVAGAQQLVGNSSRRSPAGLVHPETWNFRSRVDAFTTVQRERIKARRKAEKTDEPLPVTIIPAQQRGGRTWSPDDVAKAAGTSNSDPARRDAEGALQTQSPEEPSSNDGGLNITVVPAPTRGQRTRSPERTSHQGGDCVGNERDGLPSQQQADREDRGHHPTVAPSCVEPEQPLHAEPTSEGKDTQMSNTSHPSPSAPAKELFQQEEKLSSHDSTPEGAQSSNSSDLRSTDTVPQQQQQPMSSSSSPPPPLQDTPEPSLLAPNGEAGPEEGDGHISPAGNPDGHTETATSITTSAKDSRPSSPQ